MADNLTPVSFADLMAASEPSVSSPSAAANLTPVRYFTPDGLDEVAKLLKTIRTDKTLHRDEVEDLLDDPQYAKSLDREGDPVRHAIDRTRVFATKLELCEYFTGIFDNAFLETNRKNAGLWTWLALAYYSQFVKTKGGIVELTADARWIFDHENFQNGRRHYIAGNVYLYLDIKDAGKEAVEMFLVAGPVTQFNTITDIMTHVQAGVQSPAVMKVAGWLYYNPESKNRIKRGTTTDGKSGAARRLTTVVQQLDVTWDFYDLSNASKLWKKLPEEFDEFKNGVEH